jgi:hypothetical protein
LRRLAVKYLNLEPVKLAQIGNMNKVSGDNIEDNLLASDSQADVKQKVKWRYKGAYYPNNITKASHKKIIEQ